MTDREIKQWITVHGKHVPIYEGETKADAVRRVSDNINAKRKASKESEKSEKKPDAASNKEKKLAELKQQMEEAKGLIAKSKIKTEIEMLEADWKGTKEEWLEHEKQDHQKKVNESLERKKQEEKEKQDKKESERKDLEHELKTQPKEKVDKYKIVQEYNPMHDDYHIGIRKPSDVKTWKEAIEDEDSFAWGDFSKKDAEKALKSGSITIYSSYPIKQGVFVSTSKVQAEQYAGGAGKKLYSKTIPLEEVAWISGDEGQYANIEEWKKKKE